MKHLYTFTLAVSLTLNAVAYWPGIHPRLTRDAYAAEADFNAMISALEALPATKPPKR